jgi:hypothetical protein
MSPDFGQSSNSIKQVLAHTHVVFALKCALSLLDESYGDIPSLLFQTWHEARSLDGNSPARLGQAS